MEAQRSSCGRMRNPLSDCSNTDLLRRSSANYSSTSSLLKKRIRPFPVSSERLDSLKRLNSARTNSDKAESKSGSTTAVVLESGVSVPGSASTSTPARPLSKASGISVVDDVWEPATVYSRRQSGSKRKNEEKAIDVPTTEIHSSRGGDIRQSKSWMRPHKKISCLPMDVVEQQKAYFVEIDAFELPEEEVTSADELE